MKRIIGWVFALSVLGTMVWGMATHTLYTICICALITGIDKAIKHRKRTTSSH